MKIKNILALLFLLVCISNTTNSVYAASVIPQKNANVTVSVQASDEEATDEADFLKRFSLILVPKIPPQLESYPDPPEISQ